MPEYTTTDPESMAAYLHSLDKIARNGKRSEFSVRIEGMMKTETPEFMAKVKEHLLRLRNA
jgi:hypothetical protein